MNLIYPSMNLFPLVRWDRILDEWADKRLVEWGHFLGPCNRPFAVQSFGLVLSGELVSVAVSASTVNARCGSYKRSEVCELARLCSHPEHRDLTRVAIRLWCKTAARAWRQYWPVRAYVSYANAARHLGDANVARHLGDVYRFDGWRKVADVPGGTAGGDRSGRKKYEAKSVWAYELTGSR